MSKIRARVTFVAAALIALLAVISVRSPVHAQTPDVPAPLKQSADCMYEVLKAIPGVTEPKLRYVTRDGWTHPILEYRAAERNGWVQPTRFEAMRGDDGNYWFQGVLPGAISPDIGHIDIHVTEAVTQKWKTQCNVNVIVATV
jgi:hypothetical protein